jgi:hypothetical protein
MRNVAFAMAPHTALSKRARKIFAMRLQKAFFEKRATNNCGNSRSNTFSREEGAASMRKVGLGSVLQRIESLFQKERRRQRRIGGGTRDGLEE